GLVRIPLRVICGIRASWFADRLRARSRQAGLERLQAFDQPIPQLERSLRQGSEGPRALAQQLLEPAHARLRALERGPGLQDAVDGLFIVEVRLVGHGQLPALQLQRPTTAFGLHARVTTP